MKLSNDLMIGVAIGVGVAFLLNSKRAAAAPGPVVSNQGGTYRPPALPSPKQQKTGGAQLGRRYSRVGYPVYIGI